MGFSCWNLMVLSQCTGVGGGVCLYSICHKCTHMCTIIYLLKYIPVYLYLQTHIFVYKTTTTTIKKSNIHNTRNT